MPSVTDLQQSSKISSDNNNNNGKQAPPSSQQQQQSNSTLTSASADTSNADPITQAVLLLEKKQRNLGKRKEKLESYQQEAKSGKELNKDQQEALAKYGEVLGQIECIKEIYDQLKKIQTESAKNQKRLSKQAAEEKRVLVAQRLREYAQLRYLLDHRPSSLKAEESSLLDELARVLVPTDASLNTITRCVDTVLSIYQSSQSSANIKNLPGRTSQEVRETLEQLIKLSETSTSSTETSTPQQTQLIETVKQTPLVPQPPPTTPSSVLPQREQNKQQATHNNEVVVPSLSHSHLVPTNTNEHPLVFDTRNQNIPLHVMQDSIFFSPDLTNANNNQQLNQDSSNNQQQISNSRDNTQVQSNDPKQFLSTLTGHNSNLNNQVPSQGYTQLPPTQQQQQQGMNNYEQENVSNVVSSSNVPSDEQQVEDDWQQRRSNSGNAHRGGQYNGSGNRNYNRGGGAPNNYNQQHWRGQRGGNAAHYDGSYAGGQRQYNENNNRAGGQQQQRGGANPNYRGNRGGSYRGVKRGGGNGGPAYHVNEYPNANQYQQDNGQRQSVRSAPPSHQQ